jgi:hypothetical protein
MDQWSKAKTIIDGMPLPCAIDCIYVCMGGTHIIPVLLYWGFDVLHKDSLWIIWRWGHNCEPQVTLPT